MADLDLVGLAAKAEAATPGPWHTEWRRQEFAVMSAHAVEQWKGYGPSPIAEWTFAITPGMSAEQAECDTADADYIAAADPTTVLGLVAEVHRLRDENRIQVGQLDACDRVIEKQRVQLAERDVLAAENQQLRAQLAGVWTQAEVDLIERRTAELAKRIEHLFPPDLPQQLAACVCGHTEWQHDDNETLCTADRCTCFGFTSQGSVAALTSNVPATHDTHPDQPVSGSSGDRGTQE